MNNLQAINSTPNVPQLRFPEFDDFWTSTNLRNVSTRIGDGIHTTPSYSSNGEYYFINGNNLIDGKIIISNSTKKTNKEEYSVHKRNLGDMTILVSLNGTVGNVSIYQGEKVLLGKSVCYINLNENINKQLVYYLLQTSNVQKYYASEVTGSTIKNLSLNSVSKTLVNIPAISEQQKIAEFLATVDDWIVNLRKQKKELEKYKKGMMQNIFSHEIRFKDENGKKFPEWQETKLGEISQVMMGQSPDSKSYNTVNVGLPLIQGNADIKNRKTIIRNWTSQITKVCDFGDIIMTVRAPVGYISKSMFKACLGRGVCAIKNTRISDTEFLYQYLLHIEKKWSKFEQGSTFTAVNTQDIKKYKLLCPSLPEQQNIADFLTSLDNAIESKQKQIELVEGWKKGLLQMMFV